MEATRTGFALSGSRFETSTLSNSSLNCGGGSKGGKEWRGGRVEVGRGGREEGWTGERV